MLTTIDSPMPIESTADQAAIVAADSTVPRISRRGLVCAFIGGLAMPSAHGQATARVRRIGVLANRRDPPVPRPSGPPGSGQMAPSNPMREFITAFRQLGWIEGSNFDFEYRFAEQRYERFPELARELVALDVDLILVTAGVTAALAAKEATAKIPIVAISIADPVKYGLVESFARPGGNVTGSMQPQVDWGKFIELARDAVPNARRVAVIGNPTNVVYADYAAQNEDAARKLGLLLSMIPVARAADLEAAFATIRAARADVLVFGPDNVFLNNLREIIDRSQAMRLPVIGPVRPAAEMGAVVAFRSDIGAAFRHAAGYADRILKGAKAADLPIEQATRFELVVNVKAAKALGIEIPKALLLRADEVIE
ncbi:MAG: ABC transporter substrate-binding protein [Caldimonas sp.]